MPYLMQRNKALWGPDAEEFKPDRWFDPVFQQKVSADPFIFVPFATGPRNVSHLLLLNCMLVARKVNANECIVQCIGQNYALNETTLFLVRLLQRFDEFVIDERKQLPPPWKKDPAVDMGLKDSRSGTKRKDVERLWPGFTIVIHINGGLWMKFKKASE